MMTHGHPMAFNLPLQLDKCLVLGDLLYHSVQWDLGSWIISSGVLTCADFNNPYTNTSAPVGCLWRGLWSLHAADCRASLLDANAEGAAVALERQQTIL